MDVVVDTNVPLAARGIEPTDPTCAIACTSAVKECMNDGRLVIDDGWRILAEYQDNLASNGQPTLAQVFLKWVLTNHANQERCLKVQITQKSNDPDDYAEFPDDVELNGFDRSDCKFIAVSLACETRPSILQATDSEWWGYRDAFERLAIPVEFLCPNLISELHRGKYGNRD